LRETCADAMAPWLSLAWLLVLCGRPLERLRGALAQESMPPVDGLEADGAAGILEQQSAPPAQDEEAQDEAAADAAPSQSFTDSARELREKLGQLKSLLDKRSDSVDPGLKERLEGLTKQLSSLGLDGLADMTDSRLDGVADMTESKKSAEKQVITACISMAVKRVGLKRSVALRSLKMLASGTMKPQVASEDQLMRTIVVCLGGLSDAEFKQFTAGKLDTLPKALADKAVSSASKAEVLALEGEFPGIWEQLASAASPVYMSLKEAAAKEAPPPVPIRYGLLAGVPIVLAVAFLSKKFLDMQQDLKMKVKLKKEKVAKKKGK